MLKVMNYPLQRSRWLMLTSCLLLTGISSPVFAQKLSPADAAASVHAETQGKVLKVIKIRDYDTEKINYRVKVLTPKGQVRHMIVDGDNGEMMKKKFSD